MSVTSDQPNVSPHAGMIARLSESWRGLYNVLRASLHPENDEAWAAEAQLRLYLLASKHSSLLLPVGAVFIALAASPWASAAQCGLWVGLVAILSGIIRIWNAHIEAKPDRSLEHLRFRQWSYTITALIFLGAWCSMSVFLWVPGQPINHMLILAILSCSLAGSVAMTAVHPGVLLASFVTHLVFLIGPFALSDRPTDNMMAAVSIVFALLISGQAAALFQSMNKMLKLEHERADLVQSLSTAKEQSDRDRLRAVAAGKAKSQFLSNMNHELRTPMNAILGFSELIKTKAFGPDIDKYSEYATIIHDSGQHLLTLINDMLDLAKIEGGRLSLRESEVTLGRVIADAVEDQMEKAEERKLVLGTDIQPKIPHVFADERALRQIMVNLLSNAVKFTQPGGSVTAFAYLDRDGRVAFGVRDTGIGIAREDHAQVFERFGRSRHDVSVADQGTGLGLAIVKGFAEAHDGCAKLESDIGAGTTLTVYLPAERIRRPTPPVLKAAAS